MAVLIEEDVRTAIHGMWRRRTGWFLGSLAVSLVLAALSLISPDPASVLLLVGSVLCGLCCLVFGMFLIGFRSEAQAALRDVPRFKGDAERFRQLHRQIYRFPF